MGQDDVTDPTAVRSAIDEFDLIGRDDFLRKYSFGRARSYFIVYNGSFYDSKAIYGAAYGYQFPDRGPLASSEFSGGESHAARWLVDLGFAVTEHEEVTKIPASRTPWTDLENQIVINAYFDMLSREQFGQRYVKVDINHAVQEQLPGRGRGSVEFKFQNISAVLNEEQLPYVAGYKPAKNYQRSLREPVLRTAVSRSVYDPASDIQPTADLVELDARVKRLTRRGITEVPRGQVQPLTSEVVQQARLRDPQVKAWVLDNARGMCELCQNSGPFELPNGTRYLEVLHVIALADGGPDIVSNTVAVCPNCHRRLHHSTDREEQQRRLYTTVGRLSSRSHSG